jgi:hypothetical protein
MMSVDIMMRVDIMMKVDIMMRVDIMMKVDIMMRGHPLTNMSQDSNNSPHWRIFSSLPLHFQSASNFQDIG